MNTNLPMKVKLPVNLRYDGIQMGAHGSRWMQFTELDKTSASFGASFYLDMSTILLSEIKRRRTEKRAIFAQAKAWSPRFLAVI